MTLSETTTMATDTSLTGNHTHELMEEQKDDFIGQHEKQEQSDGPTQQDKLQQRTLALVKPDAVQANHQQAIIDKIISAGFTIIQQKQVQITLAQACLFYREHESKSFYDELTKWMSSAPIYAMVLEKENAIQDWRTLMGPTNSIKAREIDPTSIRALFGTDGSQNATHGSDCLTSAEREIDILFANDISPQSDLSTVISSTDHNDSFIQHDTSNKEQTLATTTKETDSSGDDDVLETKATTATDDTESFVPPTEATLLHTNNDVEHPVSTSDSLSHPATPDHNDAQHNNDAPTCPKSDFVELSSGDYQQSATVTTSNNTIQESTATIIDLQESISQANTDNKEPTHMKPNMDDETLEENGSQYDTGCNYDVSLSDQHQHQHQQEPTIPTTEDMIDNENKSMMEQSTPTNTHSEQQRRQNDGDKDEIVSLDSAGPDIAYIEEKVGEQEKELESTTKASETSITSAADDNITQTTDHGVDSTVNNIFTNDNNAIDTISAEQQIDQDLKKAKEDDDYQSITPEQETESLSIQDATTATETVATTTIDTTDIDDENDHAIDTTLAAASYDIKSTDFTTIESTIYDSEKARDADNEESTTYQDTKNSVDESHDDGADINTTEGHFDSILLAVDQEESKEAVTMNNIPMAGEPDADADETTTTTEVIGSTSSDVTMLKPGTDAVENTSIPVELTPETTVLEPTTSAENTSILGAVAENHDDGGVVEQVYVVEGEPESGKELHNIAGESASIEQSISEVAVTDESESTSPETLPQDVVPDEHESTMESIAVGELDATQNAIPVDTTADDIEHLKKPCDDDELQATEISLSEVAVANTVEYSKVLDESEYAKEHVTNTGINGPSEYTPAEEQMEQAQTSQSQTLTETETSDVVEPIAMDKPPTLETETDDKDEHDTTPTDDHQAPSDEDDQAKQQLEKTTVDKSDSLSSHDEDAAVDSSNTTKSEEKPVKERKIASTNPPASTTRSPGRKLPTSTAKTPVKSTSPPVTTKKLPTPGTGSTKPATTSRLRRPGTTQATGTGSSATTTTGTSVKKATPKTSTSPGRTPLPRVATLAKKPVTKTTGESKPSTTEPKPATATNKKRSSVISRLTAPTAASANKRTSEAAAAASSTAASTTKTTSGNGTIRTKVTSTSGHHAPTTTRRPTTKVSTATDKPTTKRTSHSSTADKTLTATTRRTSPPSSTTVHSKTARSTTAAPASSSRVSSTTTKSPSADATAAKRSPTRRVSPPTSTHLTSATKPITKSSKPSATEKKTDVIHKKTKVSGPTTATTTSNTVDKSDNKEKKDDSNTHLETIQNDDSATENDDESVKKSDEDTDHPTIEEHHDENLDQEVITSEKPSIVQATIQLEETTATDIEVSTTTIQDNASLNPTTTDSNTKRPRTPEMAQLRNKFENLQAPTTVTPTRSSNKQPSSAPHNIKDLISRFN